jgi:DNA-binding transcriptional LysR family regulator
MARRNPDFHKTSDRRSIATVCGFSLADKFSFVIRLCLNCYGWKMQWEDRIGRRLKLQDMHILLATVQWGSMAKAAERLAISQPVISRSIASLEHTLGVRLLERSRRGVEATMYGRALLAHGLAAFDDLKQGVKAIEVLADPTAGEVRVGCPEAIAAGLLLAVIDRFSRQYPRVVVSVTAANNMSPEFRVLRERKVDFLLGGIATHFAEDDLSAEVLYKDRPFIVSGKNSRWTHRRKIEIAELSNEPWLLPQNNIYSLLLMEAFQASGLGVPRVSVKCDSQHQRINLLVTGRFMGLLSGSVLRFNADRFALKVLPVDLAIRPWPVAVVTLKNRMLSPAVHTFIDCVRGVARAMQKRKIAPKVR